LNSILHAREQNTQTINSGISSGSKKGNAIAASISPTKARQPRTIRPTPARTKAKIIATQKKIISVSINPHTLIKAPKGLVISRPFTVIETTSLAQSNAKPRNAIINMTKINANLRIKNCFLSASIIWRYSFN
jgi:hypothetical protein